MNYSQGTCRLSVFLSKSLLRCSPGSLSVACSDFWEVFKQAPISYFRCTTFLIRLAVRSLCGARAMRFIPSALVILFVQALLLVCSPLQVLAVDGVNFGVHVENQTRIRDAMSRKHHRVYQLYSRTSGKHVQILGRKIIARGEDGDKFAQLVVEADTFGSQVRIRGKETNFYLCMNRRGKLVGKRAKNGNADCVFIEIVLENHYTAWMSARYVGWYIGFTKRGRPRRGPQTLPNQRDVHFMKRFPPGEQPTLPVCQFTTISKRMHGTTTPSE